MLKNFCLLVELSFGGRAVLDGLLNLRATANLDGLEAHIPQAEACLPVRDEERPGTMSLTVVRRNDGKLMRICRDANIDISDFAGFDDGGRGCLPVDMGGDAADGLMHPALWSVLNDPRCHHVELKDVHWSRRDGQGAIESIEAIYIGLWNPRDLINPEGAARILTAWEEIDGLWV